MSRSKDAVGDHLRQKDVHTLVLVEHHQVAAAAGGCGQDVEPAVAVDIGNVDGPAPEGGIRHDNPVKGKRPCYMPCQVEQHHGVVSQADDNVLWNREDGWLGHATMLRAPASAGRTTTVRQDRAANRDLL